ncbi:MAG: helix-turn-helix transcriptional regulator [Bacilli bacterium]|nr:helix-turn-helix transcriptional regulator [Bacilli bacterium]
MLLRLRDLREDNDLTQKEVADIINVSQVAYSYYELGRRQIDLKSLMRLANFYNTSIDYILGMTDNKKPYAKNNDNK